MNTRRQFLGTFSGAAAGALAVAGGASARPGLELVYRRTAAPPVEVRYPADWYLQETLMTDLLFPLQLFSISNVNLAPGASFDGSGLPDLAPLPDDGVLVTVYALPLVAGETYMTGIPIANGVRYHDLSSGHDDRKEGFETLFAWYTGAQYGYEMYAWVGPRVARDRPMLKAVVESFVPA